MAEPGFLSRAWRWLRDVAIGAASLAVIPAVVWIGEWLPPLRMLHAFLEAHPPLKGSLVGLTIGAAIAGTLLLAGSQFAVRVGDEQVTRLRDVTPEGKGGLQGKIRRRLPNLVVASNFSDVFTLGEVRRAFQQGIWWKEPRWRRFTLMLLGGAMLLYGLVGVFIVISPPGVMLAFGLALLYITVRMALAVYRAP